MDNRQCLTPQATSEQMKVVLNFPNDKKISILYKSLSLCLFKLSLFYKERGLKNYRLLRLCFLQKFKTSQVVRNIKISFKINRYLKIRPHNGTLLVEI